MNRRSSTEWTAGLCVFLLLGACHGRVQQQRLSRQESPREAHQGFNHRHHEQALEANRLQCEDCHKMIDEQATPELSLAGRGSCHDCHVLQPGKEKTRLTCKDCHFELRCIKPTDHLADWAAAHGSGVSQSRVACSQCHEERFCSDCHKGSGRVEK